jgi:RNA polymerase sigma factor (sigma-70 family)
VNSLTDQQLLRDYSECRSEPAFAELARRHVDLVYSAALRMVRDSHLAEDVTQGTFMALAQNAHQLAHHPVLSGWLHRTAQNLAVKIIRTDTRRRAREQEAAPMIALLSPESDAPWEHIAPHLDAALGELNEPDRDALLLRYFERKSAREMAQILGVSDEAAQKRVNRAVERLRELFAKRGVTVGAGGLAIIITTNAVQAAPAGLAVAISATAALTGTALTTPIATTTKAIAMTTLQKTLVTAALAVVASAGVYEAHQVSQLREQNAALQQQQGQLYAQIGRLQSDTKAPVTNDSRGAPTNSDELLRLRAEVTRLRNDAAATAVELKDAGNFQSQVLRYFSNTPPIRTYLSTTRTVVSWDQAILTGGWKTPSGNRAITITTVAPMDDGKSLDIKSHLLGYTETAGKALGLDQFDFDGQAATKANILTSEQAAAILAAAQRINGVNILTTPEVTTESGREAEIQDVEMYQIPSGEKYSTGPVLDVIPTISPDGQSVQMIIDSHLNYTIPTDFLQAPAN